MDISSEHKILDLKNRIEASIVIWKRKMNQKDSKSAWGSAVSLEKRELFEERAETILLLLKQRFPGIPQSSLDVSKIQYNKVRIDPLSSEFYFILHLELNEKSTGRMHIYLFCHSSHFCQTRGLTIYSCPDRMWGTPSWKAIREF
jgi:hypothetical protein